MPRLRRGGDSNGLNCAALLAAAALVVGSLGLAGCRSPSGGEAPRQKEIILATEYDDRRAGQDAAAAIEAEMGILADEELTAYVTEIGKRLLRATPDDSFRYRFQIIDQAAPNAFSLPGGGIYVSRGLLALANNEDELACVIGHEITHASERHAAAQQALSQRGLPIVAAYVRMAKLAAYSREHEHDADRGGQRLAAAAGYDPMGMSTFLRKLGNTERLRVGYSRLPGYFDTHPGAVERSATTANRAATMASQGTRSQNPRSASDGSATPDYLRHIDGLVLGINPAEGIFEASLFIHPDMQFLVRFPRSWNLFNTHQAVGAVAPERDGWIELRAGPPAESAREAVDQLIEQRGKEMRLRVKRRQPIKIGEIEAFRLEGAAVFQGQSVHTSMTLIPYNGLMFQIAAFSRSGKSDKYLAQSRNTARSFAPLSPQQRDAVEIVRLRVVASLDGESLSQLSHRTGNTLEASETAVLNGVFSDARFREGDLLKIGRPEPYLGPGASVLPD